MKSKMKRRMLAIVLCMVIALSNSSFIFASSGTEEPAAVAQEGDPQNVQETQTEAAVQDTPAVLSETTPEATPEATPEPTQVPEVTAAPAEAPQATAEPTQAPEVTAAPETTPEATPAPTETPAVTAEPTQVPEVTAAPETTPEATPVPTEEPVTYNEAVELKHEFKDENGNVTATVTAQIPAGAFQADASELTMEVTVPDQATAEHVKKLMEESLPEHYMLGDTVLYDIRFKVNGTETESQQPIAITFENQSGITVKDVKKAVVFQLDPADPAVEGDKDELVTITQRNDMIESLQNSGQSTDNVDDYDLSEITLKEDGTSNKIQMEGRTSTIYGCYAYYEPVQVLTYEDDQVIVTVSAAENGVIPANAELKVVPITEDKETEDQYKDVEKKLQEKAEEEEYEIAGFLAYDITFVDPDGNETEPNGEVKVSIDYKEAAIPESVSEEDAQNAEVSVLHLEEDENGNVAQVVDMNEAGQLDVVETDDSQQVQKIEMRTESFSAYTIYWYSYRRDIQVHYVDTEGNSLDSLAAGGWTTMNSNSALTLKGSVCEADIEGYNYLKSTVARIDDFDSAPGGTEIFRLRIFNYNMQYSTKESGSNNWTTLNRDYYTVYMVYEKDSSSSGGSGESGATGDLAHRKYVTDNSDGTYGLTLNVTGAMGTETNPAKVDVVLVLDLSGSMKEYNSSTWQTNIEDAKDAIDTLITSLSGNETVDSRWKLVTFESSAEIVTNSWESASAMKTRISKYDSGDCEGGTNYQAALTKAGAAIGTPDDNRTQIVVFLTDGQPTYHGTSSSGGGNYTKQADYDGALEGAKKITCDRFYAIGMNLPNNVGENKTGGVDKSGLQVLQDVAKNVAGNPTTQVKNVTDNSLSQIFEDIAGDIVTYTATNVTIVDILTDEVDQVENSSLTIEVRDKEGIDVTKTEVEAGNITASYNSATKQLKLDFDDSYALKQDYTYSVTMQIKPNETAKTKYVDNNYTYPDIGEADTGDTSAGKKGFYSNVKDSAKVTWTTNEETKEGLYNRPVVQLPKEDTPTPPPTTEKELSREKYVKDNKDGSYDLTLNVSGQVGSLSQKAKVDIVFVLDLSGSMANGTRLQNAKDSVNTLTSTLKNNETVDSRWKLVTFSSSVRAEDSLYNEWVTADTINSKVNGFTNTGGGSWWGDPGTGDCTGGTNYEAALTKAGEVLNADGRQDAEKIVIFLTDGQPTFYGESTTGGSDHTTQADYDGAINGAKKITCDRFYAIGMDLPDDVGGRYSNGLDMTGLELLEDVADSVNTSFRYVKNVEDIDNLASVFSDIAGSITSFLCSDVTITDTLSQWAEAADDNAKLEIKVVKKENGTETVVGTSSNGTVKTGATLTLDATETNKEATLTASYNKVTKQLVLDFPTTYQLESNYTYYVTIKIAPTAEAYQHYETNKTYPDEGDETTDAPDNNPATSSMMPGFYSNESATVTYTYNGQVETKEYLKPVIQVKESSEEDNPYIEIEKIFEGIENPEEELTDFRIEVYSDPSCNQDYWIDTLYLNDPDVAQDGNKYVWTLDDLEAGTYYLKEEGQTVEMTVGGDKVQKYTVTTTVNGVGVTDWPVTAEIQAPTYELVGEIQRDESCNEKSFDFFNNYNFIVASLKTSDQYFVWTPERLSVGEREAIKNFVKDQPGPWSNITKANANVYFYSGLDNLEEGITVNGGTVKVSEANSQGKRTLTFASGSSQWQQVLYGQYEKTDAVDAEISIVNSYEENGIDVDIVKCGTDYEVKLQGAKFVLYKQDVDQDWEQIGEYDITDAVELSKVTPGIYKLVETRAPGGFSLLDEEIIFRIQSQTVQLLDKNMEPITGNQSDMWKVENVDGINTLLVKNKALYDLPSAGGSGIFWYLISGTAFLMAASLILYRMKRKEVLGK